MRSLITKQFKASAGSSIRAQLKTMLDEEKPSFILGYGDPQSLHSLGCSDDNDLFTTPMAFSSSCRGAGTEQSLDLETSSLSVLCFYDDSGIYAVGASEAIENHRLIAYQTLEKALSENKCLGLAPDLIWCMQTPGYEEEVLAGIQDLIGTAVPIVGGSAADNNVQGEWLLSDGNFNISQGFIIVAIYSSADVVNFFSTGYELSGQAGRVTKVKGRTLLEIDHKPAFQVYNEWREQQGLPVLHPGNILANSTMAPLARKMRTSDSESSLLLSHPAEATQQHMQLFSNLQEGEDVFLVKGSSELLVERAVTVVKQSINLTKIRGQRKIHGGIVIFCGGCMLAIPEHMDRIWLKLRQEFGNIPFIIGFTFGETGTFTDGTSRHGNLMISCTLFGADDD